MGLVDSESSDGEESSHSGSKSKSDSPKCKSSRSLKHSKPFKSSKSLGKSKATSQKVSELKHLGAKGFREESCSSLSTLDRLVELKASTEEMKIKQMNSQQAAKEAQCKLKVAKLALEMDNMSEEVKVRANDLFLQLMS